MVQRSRALQCLCARVYGKEAEGLGSRLRRIGVRGATPTCRGAVWEENRSRGGLCKAFGFIGVDPQGRECHTYHTVSAVNARRCIGEHLQYCGQLKEILDRQCIYLPNKSAVIPGDVERTLESQILHGRVESLDGCLCQWLQSLVEYSTIFSFNQTQKPNLRVK